MREFEPDPVAGGPSDAGRRDLLRTSVALVAAGAAVSLSPTARAQTAADADAKFFPGFRTEKVKTSGSEIHAVVAGRGPPILLLHGAPQSRVSWHAVARDLARDHAVVVTDLRGYGDSGKVEGDAEHVAYSKRTVAAEQVEVMRHFGFERFTVFGHDRGARVTHRLALDHPDRVERAAVLDIVPTYYLFTHVTKEFAESAYHWFFFARPAPFPETVIAASLEQFVGRGAGELADEYLRVVRIPGTVHAMCEDYRAAASIDLVHDEADLKKKVSCPLLVLWGERGSVNGRYDALALWRERAANVTGKRMPGGHSFQETNPQETIAALRAFLA
ncbi:MAG TPA: alpha/beta hydrolase [Gammaproteobacteria bacterium]|nr:alpha/beta hydrolase [Gammaproteobacteria bacterium]